LIHPGPMTSSLLTNFLKVYDESILRDRIRQNLVDWATSVMASSGLTPSAHHRFLLSRLDDVAKGTIKRLMILMPPGSAKSTYASVIFPIWWFIQHPKTSIISVSHTATLVENFSRRILALIAEHHIKLGFNVLANDHSASHWQTDAGGEYFAVGLRGAITGRRADLVIIDDPIRSMRDAESAKHQQYVWDWYTSELATRLKPDARVVLVMTRWHEQDLGGQLTARSHEDWHIVRLPAIAEMDDPIGRPPGAPLWPDWESLESLNQKQAMIGSRVWSALFQQSPRPSTGHLFNVTKIQTIDKEKPEQPESVKAVRAWDLATTPSSDHNDPDWSVGLKMCQQASGQYLIEDIVRLRGNYRTVQDAILSTARLDGRSVVISLPIDPGQAAQYQISQLSALLSGYRIYASREQGSKFSRAAPVAAQLEAGNLAARPGPWYQQFIDELSSFPHGSKDDQVDALSRAFMTLCDFPKGSRRLFVPFNTR
jgi:predicted phage terminase large subunit-like protein